MKTGEIKQMRLFNQDMIRTSRHNTTFRTERGWNLRKSGYVGKVGSDGYIWAKTKKELLRKMVRRQ